MLSEFKIDTEILVDNSIIEKFEYVQNYIKQHEAEVENAGILSVIENNFNETELAMIGQLVLNEMLV